MSSNKTTNSTQQKKQIKITNRHLETMRHKPHSAALPVDMYAPYEPPKGVLRPGKTGASIAMDAGFNGGNFAPVDWGYGQIGYAIQEGMYFPGFQILSQWSQILEFRKPCEVFAREMTSKWLKFNAVGEQDKSERIAQLDAEFKRLGVQDVIRRYVFQAYTNGRAHIFVDMGDDDDNELALPLLETKSKIGKKSLKGIRTVDPMWVYPCQYNADNPLKENFYRPDTWFVMGVEVHVSRLLPFIPFPLPDILKPAYAFAGISLQQLMKPYIDNWLQTRQNISDLIKAFTVWTLKTDMSTITQDGGAESFYNRMQLFNMTRDNHAVNAVDKETEDFSNVSVPLGGLDKLQAQTQEHQAAAASMPLVYLTGIKPTVLNASSQDEIEVWQDTVGATQELLNPVISKIMNIAMLSLWGEIDPDIGFTWNSMKVVTEKEVAEIRKLETETDIAMVDAGVLAPDEIRKNLANEEESRYSGLDLNREIEKPEDPEDDQDMKSAFNESIGPD